MVCGLSVSHVVSKLRNTRSLAVVSKASVLCRHKQVHAQYLVTTQGNSDATYLI